jgi:CheY-like chemotaxis protein
VSRPDRAASEPGLPELPPLPERMLGRPFGLDETGRPLNRTRDVITLDVLMPRVDGWAVLGALKSDPELSAIPVIMVSMTDDWSLGYALGAADFMTKPIDRARLARLLERYRGDSGVGRALVVDDDPVTRELLAEVRDLVATRASRRSRPA